MKDPIDNAKPVELITSNVTYDLLPQIKLAEKTAQGIGGTPDELNERIARLRHDAATGFARSLLLSVAGHASDVIVRRALEAIGAPSCESEIWARLEAAVETKRREADNAHPELN